VISVGPSEIKCTVLVNVLIGTIFPHTLKIHNYMLGETEGDRKHAEQQKKHIFVVNV
jgi:hypothetical protein